MTHLFIQIIREFTAAYLKDLGTFHHINESLIESYRQDYNSSCSSFYQKVQKTENESQKCDSYHLSNQYNSCNQSFYHEEKSDQFKYGTEYSYKSLCINSSLLSKKYSKKEEKVEEVGRCYKTLCSNDFLYIYVGSTRVQCSRSKQQIEIPGYLGILECPDNIETICQTQRNCLNDCSSNGICIKGKCSCLKGYKGEDCSQQT